MHRPAVTQQGRQAVGGRRPRMVTSSGFPSVTYNIVYDFNNTEGNDSTTNPFVRGVAPLRPVFNDNLNTNDEYRALRREIVRLEVLVYQKYQVRTSPLGPIQLVIYGRTGGGYGPVPLPAYYEEIANINAFLETRRRNIAELNRLNAEMARIVEANEVDIIPLDFDQIVHFISWRLSDGDALINRGGALNFPYQRGPQEVSVDYEELVLTEQELVDIGNLDLTIRRMGIQNRHMSTRGVDFFGQTLNNSMARGCVKHFYANIVPALATRCRQNGHIVGGLARNAEYVGLGDMMRIDRNEWATIIREVYELTNMEAAYNLGDRLRVFFGHMVNGLYVTEEAYTRALSNIYTSTRIYGIPMTPLYKRRGIDMAVNGLGFIAKYKYVGGDPAIIREQDRAISGAGRLKPVPNFSERVRRENAKFLCVVDNNFYDPDQGSGVVVVNNDVNAMTVEQGYRRQVVVDRNTGVTVGQNGMAVGQITPHLGYTKMVNGVLKRNFRRYFGNNQYQIDYTPEQLRVWLDNSNSANMCVITSLVYNAVLQPIIEREMRMEEFIPQVALASNMYVDERLVKCDKERVYKVHRLILDWVAKRVSADIDNIYVRYYRDKTCTIRHYRTSDGLFKVIKAEEMAQDRSTLISVFFHEDHIFNITDGHLGRQSEHLKYLRKWFREHELTPRTTEIRCLFNELLVDLYQLTMMEEKWKLIKMRDFWYRKMNVRSVFLPSAMISAAGNEFLSEMEDPEDNGTEARDALYALIGRGLEARELMSLYYQCVKEPLYGYFDFETCNALDGNVRVYGYGLMTDSLPLMTRSILQAPGGASKDNETLLILDMLAQVSIPVRARAISDRERRAEDRGVDVDTLDLYYDHVKLFAHNGGRFDFPLLRNLICGDSMDACSALQRYTANMHGFKFVVESDIIAGGGIKFMVVNVLDRNSNYLFKICFVDSLSLLGCPLAKVSKEYGLPANLYEKGGYPYRFYDYVINNMLKLVWTREELERLDLPLAVRADVTNFLRTTTATTIDLVSVFDEYCKQDVNILAAGIESAHAMYHQIDVTNIRGPTGAITGQIKQGNILSDEHGIVWSTKSDGTEKRKKIRFKDSVTLPGFAKAIAGFSVLGDNVMTTNSVMHEYTSVYTGGVTYNQKVTKFYSSIIDRIARNPFFNVPGTKPDLVELMVRHGYDINKPKMTYKLYAVPPEVLQLREDLKTCADAGIYLVDSNSLYPHAIAKVGQIGGFPVGQESVIRDATHFQELLNNNKRCVVYFRVRFTVKGIARYREKGLKPMHQLLIRTKNGNRHLRPSDTECYSYGMTDIMYRSVMATNTGLFTLEFLSGVYWEECSTRFSDLMRILYEERKRWKRIKSPIEKKVKLIMNSMYGFLLEKCHYMVTEYLDTRDDIAPATTTLEYNIDTGENDEVVTPEKIIPSKYQEHMDKYAPISEYDNIIGHYVRSERLDVKTLDAYASLSYYGSLVLDMSKHEMNTLFSKLDWNVLYTDTDSAFITNQQYFRLLEDDVGKEVKFMGNELGQYKSDFDDKWEGAKRVAYDGIISIASIFLAKKLYCNVLLGAITDNKVMIPNPEFPDDRDKDIDDSDYYISINCKTAGKGAVHSALSFLDYEALADPNKALVQDRAGLLAQVFILLGGAKSGRGIHITDKNNPNRRNVIRTIKNQDAIEADTLRGRGAPKIVRKKIYQGYTPKFELINGNIVEVPPNRPTMLTLNIK